MVDNIERTKEIAESLRQSPAVATFVSALLDKIDRLGSVPNTFALAAGMLQNPENLRWFFGPAFVTISETRVAVNIKKLLERQPELLDLLYDAMRRTRRNIRGEKAALAEKLLLVLDGFSLPPCRVFADYLLAERGNAAACRGELFSLAQNEGCRGVKDYLTALAKGLAFLYADTRLVRLSRFGLEVAGNTKCCRPGTALLNSFARILYRFDADIKAEVDLSEPANDSERIRLVLDQTRLQIDGSLSRILVFGNLVFKKGVETFAYARQHAGLGEAVVLTWAQLSGSTIVEAPAKTVCIENETTFYEYAEKADPARELVICTMGQANRLVVQFLMQLKTFASEIIHWGDLDRSGVLILDSLRRRTGLNILPMRMDVDTFQAHLRKGRSLPASEKCLINSLLQRRPDIICADLLREIEAQCVWIEQENL